MTQRVVTVYAVVKRTMKAFKWVVILAGMVLIYYVDEFGDYLADDIFTDDQGVALLIFFGFLAVLVSGFWGVYYLLERLSGHEDSFTQFFSENMPGRNWFPHITKLNEPTQRKSDEKE